MASHPSILDLGEFFGFYLSMSQVPQLLERIPSDYKQAYTQHLIRSTVNFANETAAATGAVSWWNLLIAGKLASQFPNGIFVLMLRHYSGTILSLQRLGWVIVGLEVMQSKALACGRRFTATFPTCRQTAQLQFHMIGCALSQR